MFTSITARMQAVATGTRMSGETPGNAEVMAATPAATLTETVRT